MQDFANQEMNAGDWIVRAYQKYNSANLKFVKMLDDHSTIGFTKEWKDQWRVDHRRAYSYDVQNMLVISEDLVPQEVKDIYAEWSRNR